MPGNTSAVNYIKGKGRGLRKGEDSGTPMKQGQCTAAEMVIKLDYIIIEITQCNRWSDCSTILKDQTGLVRP